MVVPNIETSFSGCLEPLVLVDVVSLEVRQSPSLVPQYQGLTLSVQPPPGDPKLVNLSRRLLSRLRLRSVFTLTLV